MGLRDFFFRRGSASVAKERLRILIAQERSSQNHAIPDYLPILRQEIMAVLAKYFDVNQEQVKLNVEREGNYDILEVNVQLPDNHHPTRMPPR